MSAAADVVVLGAGPAGLGAAYRAAGAGHRVVVLERGSAPGGMAGSFEVAGLRVDLGSHRLHPGIEPRVLADLRALLGEELQRRPRNGRIHLDGRWIAFPLRPVDLVRRLPPGFAVGAARDAFLAPFRRPRADTFAEKLRAGLGPTLCERFYFPYAHKLWGVAPEALSGEQARRRVRADSPAKLVRRVARGVRGGASADFWYPRSGFGAISERLAEAAADAGAELRFGALARRVRLGSGGVRVDVAGAEPVRGARLWSTVPLPALARMSEPAPAPDVLAAADALDFRAMVLVYTVLPVRRWTPFDAHYLPDPSTPVSRVSEPRNYRDGDDPPDRTVLCAEVPCSVGDELWRCDDEGLTELVVAALASRGLPDVAPVATVVRRLPSVYPVYRIGFEHALEALDAWAAAHPRLLTFGRQGLFVHDNSHHALAMAWAAADALRPGGGFDDEAWAASRRRFATHVVED
ncbi:MAG: FAD-dependent oxidoreductase [Actinobacteria bacterium]|nr:FAD-dependent oxidoreductase [Actinomycetota bacterium]